MIEVLFRCLGRLFDSFGTFFAVRATAREKARMEAKYTGRNVRVTCGKEHYGRVLRGMWTVLKYDEDAGDLKIFGEEGSDDTTWVKPECVEIVS